MGDLRRLLLRLVVLVLLLRVRSGRALLVKGREAGRSLLCTVAAK